MARRDAVFTEGNLMRHVTVMSLSSSAGIMAIYLVDLADIFFISLLGAKQMAAAAGFASTVMFFLSAVNIGVSVATGTLVAAALGSGEGDRAREIAATALTVAISIGLTVPITMIFFIEDLVGFVGAKGEVAEMAAGYLRIVLPASVFSGISMVAVACLRADGQAKWAMYPSLVGAAINLVMDPILIFGLGLDLDGAAVATVCARLGTLAMALYGAVWMRNLIKRPNPRLISQHGLPLLKYTLPAIFSSLAAPVGMAIVMRYMSEFGPEAVAGMAVIGRLFPVIFSVVNALSGSMGPIIGQNYGAGRIDRVRIAYIRALQFLGTYVAVVGVILFFTKGYIGAAFQLSGGALELLYVGCGPLVIVAFFNGSIHISNAVFLNTGRPRYPVYLSWARATIGIMPFAHFGAQWFGAPGVLIGATTGGALFSAIAVTISFRTIERTEEAHMRVRENTTSTEELVHQSSTWEG